MLEHSQRSFGDGLWLLFASDVQRRQSSRFPLFYLSFTALFLISFPPTWSTRVESPRFSACRLAAERDCIKPVVMRPLGPVERSRSEIG